MSIDQRPRRFERAAPLYRRACELGTSTGCIALGMLHHRGLGVRQDDAKALKLFQRACELDSPRHCLFLGLAHASGRGVRQDAERARAILEPACRAGEEGACEALTSMVPRRKSLHLPRPIAIAAHGERLYLLARDDTRMRHSLWDLEPDGRVTEVPLPSPDEPWTHVASHVDGTVWLASSRQVARRAPDGAWTQGSLGESALCSINTLVALPDGRVVVRRTRGAACPGANPGPKPSPAQLERFYRSNLARFTDPAVYEGRLLSLDLHPSKVNLKPEARVGVAFSEGRLAPFEMHQGWAVTDAISRGLFSGALTLETAAAHAGQELGAEVATVSSLEAAAYDPQLWLALDEVEEGQLVGPVKSSVQVGDLTVGTVKFAVWTRKRPARVHPFEEVRTLIADVYFARAWTDELIVVDRELTLDRGSVLTGVDDTHFDVVPLPDGFITVGHHPVHFGGTQWKEDSLLLRAVRQWRVMDAALWGEQLLVTTEMGGYRLLGLDGVASPRLPVPRSHWGRGLVPISPERWREVSAASVIEFSRDGRLLSKRSLPMDGGDLGCIVHPQDVAASPGATWILCNRDDLLRFEPMGMTRFVASP
ncbi:sel1 repeat family protein [Corallococcus sp. EGB]|uniref:sel1 repeat family protein n=1 Tax=Corallococcus sp. EGB TaxID=1521117 RepID=UPI001CC1200B|nr:sel1 repeat family protein [Corallococcus sp. EGB]